MKTLNLYVTKHFLGTLFFSVLILTFGMMGVHLIKVFNYISKGIPVISAFQFLLYVMPVALSLTIPFGILVSVMLVFGRMSADNEITAMRACGISILQIISPILLATGVLTAVCLFLNMDLGPRYIGKAKNLVLQVSLDQPLAILEAGQAIEFDNLYIYIGEKEGNDKLKDIQVFVMSKKTKQVEQDITATHGTIKVDKENQKLIIVLEDATVVAYQANSNKPARSFASRLEFPFEYGKELSQSKLVRRVMNLPFKDLLGRTIFYKRMGKETTSLEVELNQRIAISLSPIAFLLLGLPLAIRTSRRETSIGLFLSVILAGVYFASVMICHSLDSRPQFHPEVLLWIPNVLYQIFGLFFILRIARR